MRNWRSQAKGGVNRTGSRPNITTQGELNEAEAQNILRGQEWARRSRTSTLVAVPRAGWANAFEQFGIPKGHTGPAEESLRP